MMMKNIYVLLSLFIAFVVKSQDITTVAGTGSVGFSGDGGPALQAKFNWIWGVTVKGTDIFISDWDNNRIRKVNSSGIISTIAGNGNSGFAGDGGLATSAELSRPSQVVIDKYGNIYTADNLNKRIRKIAPTGTISTFAGTGVSGNSGDGGLAINAQFVDPLGLAIDSKGNLYVADYGDNKIRKIDSLGIITTFCGSGTAGYSGDGGPAISAQLKNPARMTVDKNDNIYFVDVINYCIRKVTASGTITTVAGNGTSAFSGDGGQATLASLYTPAGVEVDSVGNVYIAEFYGHRIRKVNLSGIINTIAGTGLQGFSGDGGPAISAQFNGPCAISVDKAGKIFIAETFNERIRVICPSNCFAGIDEYHFQSNELFIYPNPSSGVFKLKSEIAVKHIALYNSLGQKIHEQNLNSFDNTLDFEEFPNGIYNYVVNTGQTIYTGKLTIQK